jgi:hypothetical protein
VDPDSRKESQNIATVRVALGWHLSSRVVANAGRKLTTAPSANYSTQVKVGSVTAILRDRHAFARVDLSKITT